MVMSRRVLLRRKGHDVFSVSFKHVSSTMPTEQKTRKGKDSKENDDTTNDTSGYRPHIRFSGVRAT